MTTTKINVEALLKMAKEHARKLEAENKEQDSCWEEAIRTNMEQLCCDVQSQIADKLEHAAQKYGKLQVEFTILEPHVLSPKVFYEGSDFNRHMEIFAENNRIDCELTIKKDLYRDPIKVRVKIIAEKNAKGSYKISRE